MGSNQYFTFQICQYHLKLSLRTNSALKLDETNQTGVRSEVLINPKIALSLLHTYHKAKQYILYFGCQYLSQLAADCLVLLKFIFCISPWMTLLQVAVYWNANHRDKLKQHVKSMFLEMEICPKAAFLNVNSWKWHIVNLLKKCHKFLQVTSKECNKAIKKSWKWTL
mgnify:CR=1 FL=1